MPNSRTPVAAGGLALAVAGLLYVPLPFVPGWTRLEDIGTPSWWIAHNLATIHHFLLLFGLFGLFAAQREPAGRHGLIAFVLAALGNALAGGIGIVQLAILPTLAANPETQPMLVCTPFHAAATNAAQAFIDSACAAWSFDVLAAWVGASRLTLLIGSIALGIAIARAAVLPRWTGVVLALGAAYQGTGWFLTIPEAIESLGLAAIGVAYVVCGAALFRGRAA